MGQSFYVLTFFYSLILAAAIYLSFVIINGIGISVTAKTLEILHSTTLNVDIKTIIFKVLIVITTESCTSICHRIFYLEATRRLEIKHDCNFHCSCCKFSTNSQKLEVFEATIIRLISRRQSKIKRQK